MNRAPTSSGRRPLDFYPTPHNVTLALLSWAEPMLTGESSYLDPAAGDGDIIKAARSLDWCAEAHWSAIEIDEQHGPALENVAENVAIGDALSREWPRASVICNPPFGLLDAFWERACLSGDFAACLAPVAWLSAERRRASPRPHAVLQLGWRPRFVHQVGAAHKGSQDFAWLVRLPYAPAHALWERLEKPAHRAEAQ